MTVSDGALLLTALGSFGTLAGVLYRKSTDAEKKAAAAQGTAAQAQVAAARTDEFAEIVKGYGALNAELVRMNNSVKEELIQEREIRREEHNKLSARLDTCEMARGTLLAELSELRQAYEKFEGIQIGINARNERANESASNAL